MARFNSYKEFIHNPEFSHTSINSFEEDIWPSGTFVWLSAEEGVEYVPEEDTVYADGDQLVWEICPQLWDGTVEEGYTITRYCYKIDGKKVTSIELEKRIRERVQELRSRIEPEDV